MSLRGVLNRHNLDQRLFYVHIQSFQNCIHLK